MTTKRMVFILGALLIISSTVVAQPVFLGIRGGANLSRANGPAFSDQYKLGWEVGPYVGFNLFGVVGLQAEALYSWTRISTVDYVNAQNTGIEPGKKKLNYLSIPFLIRLNLGKYFTINGGPQLNVLANKDKYKLDNGSEAFKNRYTNWVAGFEINIPQAKNKTCLYARYNWGDGFENIGDRKDATISRFQLGVFIPILGQ
ncbi:MAG: outer membrane beta-barrel protein [Chitinophagaceae bacterium]|nr:outer membrane beta-barrel protein [Chitinophagaceae bacterium]